MPMIDGVVVKKWMSKILIAYPVITKVLMTDAVLNDRVYSTPL